MVGDRSAKRRARVLSLRAASGPDGVAAEPAASNPKVPDMIRKIRIPLALVAALGLSAAAQSSLAQVGHVPNTREVYSRNSNQIVRETDVVLADLDLSTRTDIQRLLGRIQDGADAVCGGPGSIYSDASRKQYMACRQKAIAEAVAKMRLPALTAEAARGRQPELSGK
jgi:UrcA family protein